MDTDLEIPKKAVRESKKETIKRIKEKFDIAKFGLIIDCLKQQGIDIPEDIKNLKSLKKYAKNLDSNTRNTIKDVTNQIGTEISEMVSNLEAGSKTAFSKFIESMGKIGLSLAKSMTVGLAGNTGILLAPTIGSKLVVAGVIAARGIYKWKKGEKERKKAYIMKEYNKVLEEREDTYNKEGELVDTRYNIRVQEAIRDFMKLRGIKLETDGYLELREAVFNLELEDKKTILQIINKAQGRDEKDGFIDEGKVSSLLGGIGKGAAMGASVATVINSTDITDAVLETGFVEEILEAALSSGMLALGLGIGAAVGTTLHIGTRVFRATKDTARKIDLLSKQKKRNELDRQLYGEENRKELTERISLKKPTSVEKAMLEIISEVIKEGGVKLPENIENAFQLELAIKGLNKKDKKIVLTQLNRISEANIENSVKLKNVIKKVGKALCWVPVIGLAGLSIYNIFSPGFLEELSKEIAELNDRGVNFDELLEHMVPNEVNNIEQEFLGNNSFKYEPAAAARAWLEAMLKKNELNVNELTEQQAEALYKSIEAAIDKMSLESETITTDIVTDNGFDTVEIDVKTSMKDKIKEILLGDRENLYGEATNKPGLIDKIFDGINVGGAVIDFISNIRDKDRKDSERKSTNGRSRGIAQLNRKATNLIER